MSAPCSEVTLQLLFSSFQDQILPVQEELPSSGQSKNDSIIKLWHLISFNLSFILRPHSVFCNTETYHQVG